MNGMSFVVGYGQKQPKNEQAAAAAAKRITPPDEPDERTRRRIRRTNTRSVNRLRRWLPLFGWVVPFFFPLSRAWSVLRWRRVRELPSQLVRQQQQQLCRVCTLPPPMSCCLFVFFFVVGVVVVVMPEKRANTTTATNEDRWICCNVPSVTHSLPDIVSVESVRIDQRFGYLYQRMDRT